MAAVELRLPPSGPGQEDYRGAAGEAKLRVGSDRLISLIEL